MVTAGDCGNARLFVTFVRDNLKTSTKCLAKVVIVLYYTFLLGSMVTSKKFLYYTYC